MSYSSVVMFKFASCSRLTAEFDCLPCSARSRGLDGNDAAAVDVDGGGVRDLGESQDTHKKREKDREREGERERRAPCVSTEFFLFRAPWWGGCVFS